MTGRDAFFKQKSVQVFAMETIAKCNFIKAVLALNRRCSFKLHEMFIEVLNICIYFHELGALTNVVYWSAMNQITFLKDSKVRTYFLNFVEQVTCKDDRLAMLRDLLGQLSDLGDTHRIKSVCWL